ncbi:MAG: hypothetical protein ABEJ81_01605 [Haloferacaceae archaeon]
MVAGAAVGALCLGAVVAVDLRRPARAFGLAAAFALPALRLAGPPGPTVETAAVTGGTVGGGLAWLAGGGDGGTVSVPVAAVGVAVAAGLWAGPAALGAPLAVVAVAAAGAVALVVGLPWLVDA